MAWNYEKGCEEPAPYKHTRGGVYTPPAYGPSMTGYAMKWEAAEARVPFDKYGKVRDGLDNRAAIETVKILEFHMLFEDLLKIPEMRRGYIEWLAKQDGVLKDACIPSEIEEKDLPLLQRIIARGYRELAKSGEYQHPDLGGDSSKFRELSEGNLKLQLVLKELEGML